MDTLWASGSMDKVYYGKYYKTPASLSREDWKQRKELTENPEQCSQDSNACGRFTLKCSLPFAFGTK